MSLTRRANLLRLLAGEQPAWTPCAINFNQWFGHHRNHGSLPAELRDGDYLHAMKLLGCDIFSRNLGGGCKVTFPGVEEQHEKVDAGGGHSRHINRFVTPHGTLRCIREDQPEQTTSYQVEDLVKDWNTEGQAYRYWLEQYTADWDEAGYLALDERVGDDGLVMIPGPCTPLKRLQIDFGLDHACLFLMDEPQAARELCALYWSRVRAQLVRMAEHPRVQVMCLMDNVDSPFYPPALCADYWTPYVADAVSIFAPRGKRVLVHACGRLRALKQVFRDSGVHGLEGMAHSPLGDFDPADVHDMPSSFIYNGGFGAHEQVTRSDDDLRKFYAQHFAALRGHAGFIFASACQTTVTTPWARIKLAVQLCREFGGRPNA